MQLKVEPANYYATLQATIMLKSQHFRNTSLHMSQLIHDLTPNKEALSYEETFGPTIGSSETISSISCSDQ